MPQAPRTIAQVTLTKVPATEVKRTPTPPPPLPARAAETAPPLPGPPQGTVSGEAVTRPTPLFAAVKAGQVDSVRVLLGMGADSVAGDSSLTALEYAIWLGNTAMVRELVKGGRTLVNVRHPSATESPLHAAIRCRNPDHNVELMRTLIAAGADVKALDKNGDTPLQMLEKKRAAETLPAYLPCYDSQLKVLRAAQQS